MIRRQERHTLLKQLIGVAAAAAFGVSVAQAQAELPGNMFHQFNPPSNPNVGIGINNPQNMGGGQWVGGSTASYPVYGPSPVLDGDINTVWNAGTFGGGGMCNVGIGQGYYNGDGSFTFAPFSAIGTIRIWAQNYQNSDSSWWITYPHQIAIGYTTGSVGLGNGYSFNSGTVGIIPGWATSVPITAVNGGAPAAAGGSYSMYDPNWVGLDGSWTGSIPLNSHTADAYVDLSVNIPAGATCVLVSFGQDNGGTLNPGGLSIGEIQAIGAVPEPSTLALLGLCGLMLIRRPSALQRRS